MSSILIYLSLIFLFPLPIKAQNITWQCKVFRSMNEKNKITTIDISFNTNKKTINESIKATGLNLKEIPIVYEDKYKSKGWLVWRDGVRSMWLLETYTNKIFHNFYGIEAQGKCKRR